MALGADAAALPAFGKRETRRDPFLFEYLDDASQIVKTFSMQALFDMSEDDPKLRARVVPILQGAVETGGGATRSRARKLLKQIL